MPGTPSRRRWIRQRLQRQVSPPNYVPVMPFTRNAAKFGGALVHLSWITRQPVMDCGRGQGGMAGRNSDLMQIAHDIADRVKTVDAALLMLIHNQGADRSAARAERGRKPRARLATKDWIKQVRRVQRA